MVGRLKQSQNETKPSPAPIPTNSFPPPQTPTQARSIYLRLAAMAVIALVGSIGVAHAFQLSHSPEALAAAARDHGSLNNFPDHIQNYSLVRTWNENLNAATLLFHWAE